VGATVTGPVVVRVDAHHHVWDLARRPQPWTDDLPVLRRSFSFDEVEPDLADAGFDATVVVHTVASFEETLELLALAADRPRIAGVVGWFDLCSPDLAGDLGRARRAPGGEFLVGARHQLQVEPDPRWLSRPEVRDGLRTLAAHGLTYDLVVSAHQLPLVVDTVRALPEVRFVLDHAGKPPIAGGALADWRRDLAQLSRSANVAVKLSGLVTEADWAHWTVEQLRPVATAVLEDFGPRRAMFGSDWPVCLLAASYPEVVTATGELLAGLDEAGRRDVWGATARHWYGLGGG
jgi:L-fuconolactonase